MISKIEEILLKFDRGDDRGQSYKEYYKEVFEVDYEPNMCEGD